MRTYIIGSIILLFIFFTFPFSSYCGDTKTESLSLSSYCDGDASTPENWNADIWKGYLSGFCDNDLQPPSVTEEKPFNIGKKLGVADSIKPDWLSVTTKEEVYKFSITPPPTNTKKTTTSSAPSLYPPPVLFESEGVLYKNNLSLFNRHSIQIDRIVTEADSWTNPLLAKLKDNQLERTKYCNDKDSLLLIKSLLKKGKRNFHESLSVYCVSDTQNSLTLLANDDLRTMWTKQRGQEESIPQTRTITLIGLSSNDPPKRPRNARYPTVISNIEHILAPPGTVLNLSKWILTKETEGQDTQVRTLSTSSPVVIDLYGLPLFAKNVDLTQPLPKIYVLFEGKTHILSVNIIQKKKVAGEPYHGFIVNFTRKAELFSSIEVAGKKDRPIVNISSNIFER